MQYRYLLFSGIITLFTGGCLDRSEYPYLQKGHGSKTITACLSSAAYYQKGGSVTRQFQQYETAIDGEAAVEIDRSGSFELRHAEIITRGNAPHLAKKNRYGNNAGILVAHESSAVFTDCTINSSGSRTNGIIVANNSSITASNIEVHCSGEDAHALSVNEGGSITAENIHLTTSGNGARGISAEKNEGTIKIGNGTIATEGSNSPAIYSAGIISVKNLVVKTENSEAAIVEGENSLVVLDSTLHAGKKGGVLLYTPNTKSGKTTSIFTMSGGTLTSEEGALFAVSNTTGIIKLSNTQLSTMSGILLDVSMAQWNKKQTSNAQLIAEREKLTGTILCDTLSSVTIILKNNTALIGSINFDNSAKSVSLIIDPTSRWAASTDSYLTEISVANNTTEQLASHIDAPKNITIYYKRSEANQWLGNNRYKLKSGGELIPLT